MRLFPLLLPLHLFCDSASSAASISISASSPLVAWSGRTVLNADGSVTADWAAVSATISISNNFTYALVHLEDRCAGGNKVGVALSGEGVSSFPVASFYTTPRVTVYPLFAAAGRLSFYGAQATLRLSKSVEARFTQCGNAANLSFLAFESDGIFLPPTPPARRLEFIGDSITSASVRRETSSLASSPAATAIALMTISSPHLLLFARAG